MSIDQSTLTKGQVRKLNALRKSVGNVIADVAFGKWMTNQSKTPKEVRDPVADALVAALANLKDAEEFAITWYEDRLLEKRASRERGALSFAAYAEKFQDTQNRLIRRGELVSKMYREDALKLTSDVLPRFGEMQITKIDYHAVDAFIDEMKVERDLSQSTLIDNDQLY